MRFTTLDAWLDWQATLNPAEIDLGLDRVARVLQRMGHSDHFEVPMIMVAGTNGKGSVVALLEAMALAAGYRVCSYTSPHILHYNERIKINAQAIADEHLCQAFERVDQARGDVPLTYFEFGTLAAIDLFMRETTDLVILEVGLGGRLDAVNVMHPDIAVITPIALDHTDWLGDNREAIAREKAGILRDGQVAVCGDSQPPQSLLRLAERKSVRLQRLGVDYHVDTTTRGWRLRGPYGDIDDLPAPALVGSFQKQNAATAIVALQALSATLPVSVMAIREGLTQARLPGRFEQLQAQPRVIVDIAHNPHAVASLVSELRARTVPGRNRVVIAMLADKPVEQVVQQLLPIADFWYTAGLEQTARGLPAAAMAASVRLALHRQGSVADADIDVKLCAESTVEHAITRALADSAPQDRIIILGSFFTVAAAKCFFDDGVPGA